MVTTPEEAKVAVQRWFNDIWNRSDEQAVDELLAPDFVLDLSFNRVPGREAFKHLLQANHAAFEGLTYSADDDDIVAENDKAAAFWTMDIGKHRGAWQGIPPSGNGAVIHGMSLFLFSHGQISEIRVISDVYSLMRQIGGIKQ